MGYNFCYFFGQNDQVLNKTYSDMQNGTLWYCTLNPECALSFLNLVSIFTLAAKQFYLMLCGLLHPFSEYVRVSEFSFWGLHHFHWPVFEKFKTNLDGPWKLWHDFKTSFRKKCKSHCFFADLVISINNELSLNDESYTRAATDDHFYPNKMLVSQSTEK